MKTLYGLLPFVVLLLVSIGCEPSTDYGVKPNSNLDVISDWSRVECPRCDGQGRIWIDRNHPLHEAGYPIGWMECDYCEGDRYMLTNGHGVYTRLRK
jgi:hypothetical protein